MKLRPDREPTPNVIQRLPAEKSLEDDYRDLSTQLNVPSQQTRRSAVLAPPDAPSRRDWSVGHAPIETIPIMVQDHYGEGGGLEAGYTPVLLLRNAVGGGKMLQGTRALRGRTISRKGS